MQPRDENQGRSIRPKSGERERFIPGDSELTGRFQAFNWSKTGLGSPENWPGNLRTAVEFCLTSRFPVVVWWGDDLTVLYNDAVIPILGDSEPTCYFGRPGRECWPEFWHIVEPILREVLGSSRAAWRDDLLFFSNRHGYPEECYLAFSFSPIRSDSGEAAGVYAPIAETTDKVINERRLGTLRNLTARIAEAQDVESTLKLASEAVRGNPFDIPFALLYRIDALAARAWLVDTAGIAPGTQASAIEVELDVDQTGNGWPLDRVARTGRTELVERLADPFGALPGGAWSMAPESAWVLPVTLPGSEQPVAILVAAVSPHRAFDQPYRDFYDRLVAELAVVLAANRPASTQYLQTSIERRSRNESFLTESQRIAHIGNWSWCLETNEVIWSDELYRIFGLRPQQMIMTPELTKGFIDPDDLVIFDGNMNQAIGDHQPFAYSFRIRREDGSMRVVLSRGRVELKGDGKAVRLFGTIQDITEQTQAEEALRASEQRFRAVFERARDAMIIANNDSRYVDVNPAACELFGLPRDLLLGKTGREFTEPAFAFDKIWAEFLQSGFTQGTTRVIRADGTARDTEYLSTANFLPGLHLAVLRDITERVRTEEALRESELRGRVILESITDAFCTVDRQWRLSYINPQTEPLLGKSREKLLGRNIWEEFPEAVGTEAYLQYHRVMNERVSVHFELDYPPLGRWFSIHAYPTSDGISVYFTDVTERHRAEDALKQSERRFRRVLENSRDIIYQFNLLTNLYDYVSPSARHVLGDHFEELAPTGLPQLIASNRSADSEWLVSRNNRKIAIRPGTELDMVVEYQVQVPRKGWRWLSDSGSVVRNEQGRPVAVVGNVRDVTEERLAEKRLQDLSRRLVRAQEEERRHIARELHDEIGQALTAIKLTMQGALRHPTSPPATHRLEEGIGLVERTIAQVRDLSLNLRPSMLDDLGLLDALRSHVSEFAKRSRIQATFVAEEEMERLDADIETACYRIAQEALTNVARHARSKRVRVELRRRNSALDLIVTDFGCGFDVAAATARAASGSSLGVLSMRERATLLGGRVEIESEPGRGTRVRATFPLDEARPIVP